MDILYVEPVCFDDISDADLKKASYVSVALVKPNGSSEQIEGGKVTVEELGLPPDAGREILNEMKVRVEELIYGHLPPGAKRTYMVRVRASKGNAVIRTYQVRVEREGTVYEEDAAPIDANSHMVRENDALLAVPAMRAVFAAQAQNTQVTGDCVDMVYRMTKRMVDTMDDYHARDCKRKDAEIEAGRAERARMAAEHERERKDWSEERERLNRNLVELVDAAGQTTDPETGKARATRLMEEFKRMVGPLVPMARQAGVPIPPGFESMANPTTAAAASAAPANGGGPFDGVLEALLSHIPPEKLITLDKDDLIRRIKDHATRANLFSLLGIA